MTEKYQRKHYYIDASFQRKFIIRFCLIVILSSLLIGWGVFALSQGSTTVAIENTRVFVKQTSDFILPVLVGTIVIVTVFSAVIVLLLTLFASHKIAGPAFRLKRELDFLKTGDLTRDFSIRRSDELQALAQSLREMADFLRTRNIEIKSKFGALEHFLREQNYSISEADKDEICRLLEDVSQAMKHFKV